MPGEADRLRRSKRNKFFLDVSQLGTTDRRRTQPGRVPQLSPYREETKTRAQSASPIRADSSASSQSAQEEDTKRPRRANRSSNFYYEDDSDDDDDTRVCGMTGMHRCEKCPSRFETRPGLANHMRLHGGSNRKYSCEECDFSCGSLKAIRNHRKCHRRLEKEDTPTHSDTRSEDDSNASPPKLTAEIQKESPVVENASTVSSPPQLNAATNTPAASSSNSNEVSPETSESKDVEELKVEAGLPGNQVNKFECPHCPFKCRNRRRLQSHMDGHRKTTGFRCHRCTMTTSSSGFLKLHITQIHKESNFPWPPRYFSNGVEQPSPNTRAPSVEKKKFLSKKGFRPKMFPREARRDGYKLICPIGDCGFICYTTAQIASHKHCFHNTKFKNSAFRCTTCGMRFRHKGNLKLHRIRKHSMRKFHPKAKMLLINEARGRHFLKGVYNNRPNISNETNGVEEAVTPVAPAPIENGANGVMPCNSTSVVQVAPPQSVPPMPMTVQMPNMPTGMHMQPQMILPNHAASYHPHPHHMVHPHMGSFMAPPGTIVASIQQSVIQQVPQIPRLCTDLPDYLKPTAIEMIDANDVSRMLEQSFKCPSCPFSTTARMKLDKHTQRHQLKSDLKCPLCSYHCRGESFMQQHFRVHVALAQKLSRLPVTNPSDLSAAMLYSGTPYVPIVPNIGYPMGVTAAAASTPPSTSSGNQTVGAAATAAAAAARLIRNDRLALVANRNKKERTFIPVILPDGTRLRRCLECPYASKHSCDISTHYQMHLSPQQKFKCSQCTYSTKRSVCLRVHYEQHRTQNSTESTANPLPLKINGVPIGLRSGKGKLRIYSCKMCPFAGRTLSSLWRHARNHIFIRNPSYRCPSCDFFGNKEVLDQHVLLHTPEVHPMLLRSTQTPISIKKDANGDGTTTPISNKPASKSKKAANKVSTEPNSKISTPNSTTPPPPTLSPAPVLTREDAVEETIKLEDIKKEGDEMKYEPEPVPHAPSGRSARAIEQSLKYNGPLSIEIVEKIATSHPILDLLRKEEECQVAGQCPDCPYTDSDEVMMRIHRDMHTQPPRTHQCELCTFSSNTPQCLYRHISLHLPPLSPSSAAALKQKSASRRRYQQNEIIPAGAKHFACYKCPFKTVHSDKYEEHVYQHVEDYRRRLNTTTKREQMTEESKKIKVQRRNPKKTDKLYSCDHCSFRCETIAAMSRHFEMHSLNGLYSCSMCSYSANTKSITQFHEMNHHSDHSVTNLQKSAILAPKSIRLPIDSSPMEIPKLAGQMFNCIKCKNFSCIESRDLEMHWVQFHNETPEDKEQAKYISFGMYNVNGIATIA